MCSVMGVLGVIGAGSGMIPFALLEALRLDGEWTMGRSGSGDQGLGSGFQAKRQRLGQGNHRGTGEGVEWTPQTVGMGSIGLEDDERWGHKKQSSMVGRSGVLGSSCLSRASFGSGRQLSLGLGMRPGLGGLAKS